MTYLKSKKGELSIPIIIVLVLILSILIVMGYALSKSNKTLINAQKSVDCGSLPGTQSAICKSSCDDSIEINITRCFSKDGKTVIGQCCQPKPGHEPVNVLSLAFSEGNEYATTLSSSSQLELSRKKTYYFFPTIRGFDNAPTAECSIGLYGENSVLVPNTLVQFNCVEGAIYKFKVPSNLAKGIVSFRFADKPSENDPLTMVGNIDIQFTMTD